MPEQMASSPTVLEELVVALRARAAYNRNEQVAPAVVLWPDKEREWEPILPALREKLPALLVLGPYQKGARMGPAIWVRCMLARTLDEADWPEDEVPILYLPGVSRQELRAVESCPKALQPLAELQYRGEFWSQVNGKDWTVFAFLKSMEGGLGLDVSRDAGTQAAIARALKAVAAAPVHHLRGRRLEAGDFDALLSGDTVRDILLWFNDPARVQEQWGTERWAAFRSVCQRDYGLDPQASGELAGAELLGNGKPPWNCVWSRFEEAPRLYPNIPDLLDRAAPQRLLLEGSHWPKVNARLEDTLRQALADLDNRPAHEACEAIKGLEARHGNRRHWVWAKLGQAPLAQALEPLHRMAVVAGKVPAMPSVAETVTWYTGEGWRADIAVLDALCCVRQEKDVAAVGAAVRSVYGHWIEETALGLQKRVAEEGCPKTDNPETPATGSCVLFADGLRFDLGKRLAERMEARGLTVEMDTRWTSLPSVTDTSKPAMSPIAHLVAGTAEDEEFQPKVAASGKPLSAYYFKKLLEENGWQSLDKGELGDPRGRAWCEYGSLDRYGHEQGWKLAWRVEEELESLVERIEALMQAGWKRVRILTDHGWLLLPGGLPKKEMPAYLSKSRWGRCARLKGDSSYDGPVVSWRWCEDVRVALPAGIGTFFAGQEYAHGGLSLQECLVPVLTVTSEAPFRESTLEEPVWRGLRCRVSVLDAMAEMIVDLRTRPADGTSSVAGGGKALDENGKASLLVEDDALEGRAVSLVLVDHEGRVIARLPTTVGGED